MKSLEDLLARWRAVQAEFEADLEAALQERREAFHYRIEQGRVRFADGIRALQRQHRIDLWRYLFGARISHILSAPIIYSLIVPLVLLDVMASLYQHTCFRIYGIERVLRRDYIIIDRHLLGYLNLIEKINCVYCGYGNGVIAYVREIAARTERYWCPIKHARRSRDPHELEASFIDYGDAEGWKHRSRPPAE
jgi:hypothetical protein